MSRRFSFDIINHHAELSSLQIIDSYKVNGCQIYITQDGQYLIIEPPLTKDVHSMYSQIMEYLYHSLEPLDGTDDPIKYVEDHIWKEAEQQAVTGLLSEHFQSLRYYLVRDILGYGILDVLMRDENVEEITIERFDRNVGLVHRKHTEFNILNTNFQFGSFDLMNSFIQRLVQKSGNSVTTAMPIMNAMTKDGDRITVTYGNEISLPGPTIDIRKFTRAPLTIAHLLRMESLDELITAYLWMLIDAKSFGLVIGETGSGKTTLINALIGMSNPRWKIVTIEETPELKIPHYRWVRLVTRSSPMITRSNFDITIMDLIKASLRMRPDFEVVGEVRGQEAQYLFQSAATGHGGLTSFHASGAESALNRLSSEPINIKTGQHMLLWYILHMTRLRDQNGNFVRKVISIKEVLPKSNSISFNEIFSYDRKTGLYDTRNIAHLLEKSIKVYDAAKILNVEPEEDLQSRISFLTRLKHAQTSYNNACLDISQYYSK